jgi:hypothetical protein
MLRREKSRWSLVVEGYFEGGLGGLRLEKQIPRARKKALGMTTQNTHYQYGGHID